MDKEPRRKRENKYGPIPKDPYIALGVTPNSTKDEIKRAYRILSQKYHPDLNPEDEDAIEWFRIISEAKEILTAKPGRESRSDHYFKGFQVPPTGAYRPGHTSSGDASRQREEKQGADRARQEEETRQREATERQRREDEERARQAKDQARQRAEQERARQEEAERARQEEETRQREATERQRREDEERARQEAKQKVKDEKIAEIKARIEVARGRTGQTAQGATVGSREEKEAEIRARVEASRGKTGPSTQNEEVENQDEIKAKIKARIESSKSRKKN